MTETFVTCPGGGRANGVKSMFRRSNSGKVAASIAALSLAMPAGAADLPAPVVAKDIDVAAPWSSEAETTAYRGRYYDPYRYRHRRNRVDAGDVIAGVLILGGIAAVANAVKNSNRDDRYRNRDYRDDRYPDEPYRNSDATGIDRAASMCVSAIERDARVESVDNVARTAAGWTVTGLLFDGQGFTCSIGQDGRIDAIDYGARSAPYGTGYEARGFTGEDTQLSDDRYRAARADFEARGGYAVVPDTAPILQGSASANPPPTRLPPEGPVPAYPGGPLPGDPGYDD